MKAYHSFLGSRSNTIFDRDLSEQKRDSNMRHSSILVITIAITIVGTEAVPEAPAGNSTFLVGNGTSLCNFQQCQCVNESQSLMTISCDCKNQVWEGEIMIFLAL